MLTNPNAAHHSPKHQGRRLAPWLLWAFGILLWHAHGSWKIPLPWLLGADGRAVQIGVTISTARADDDGDDSGQGSGTGAGGGTGTGGGTGATGGASGSDGNSSATNSRQRASRFPLFTLPWAGSDYAAQELLVTGLTARQNQQLVQAGYNVVVQRNSRLVGAPVARVSLPQGVSLRSGADAIQAIAPRAVVDLNHFYTSQSVGASPPQQLVGWGNTPQCNQRVVIGMIDTRIDRKHPALAGQALTQLSVHGDTGRESADAAHGTAVASLLIGKNAGTVAGLLPRAQLIAVDAFHKGPRGTSRMDAFDLAAALDMLVQRGVKTINLSFAGPPNALIETSVRAAVRSGVSLVAAVGNDGAAAEPRYPAAYPGVVGVTAVQQDLQLFRRAVRGAHVALAAPGVDLRVADPAHSSGYSLQSGTSYAAPYVTAAVALVSSQGLARRVSAGSSADAIKQFLVQSSRDLGANGFDPMYGHGLLQMNAVCRVTASTHPALMALR
jgi:subtilisin family serine protease